eukprot:TRINITY_DN50128_c0_g1_i1.p1 TRINITY_DN50128_c0_g1~~TRINITY_DN50128_c0_g1_i1.p1  ORF type:complete len:614 (+),score=66.01 TRINITY_DN50128_c0_g1_i1:46-1887(+)
MDCFDAVDWLANEENKVPPCGHEFCVTVATEHLGLYVRIANVASWNVSRLGVGQESLQHRGYQGSIQGLLVRARNEVEMSKGLYPQEQHSKFDEFLVTVDRMLTGAAGDCTLSVRDPSGLSMVSDILKPCFTMSRNFKRTVKDDQVMMLQEAAYFEYPLPETQLSSVEEVASLINKARRVVALTGAGVSVESGITPFRNPSDDDNGSLWGKFDVRRMTQQGFNSDTEITRAWWDMKRSVYKETEIAVPNPAHNFFGLLDQAGRLETVITQNIDSMHQKGGVSDDRIIELHGNIRRVICSDHKTPLNPMPYAQGKCHFTCTWTDVDEAIDIPTCPQCGCPLRTETVMFGQPMPEGAMNAATEAVASADLLIIIGSTLVVEPANTLPAEALCRRTPVVMINFDETKYDANVTALVRQKAGAFLQEVTRKLVLSGLDTFSISQEKSSEAVQPTATERLSARLVDEALRRNNDIAMRSSSFFCAAVDVPQANLAMLQRSMDTMNERGSDGVGKMLFSSGKGGQLGIVAYVPEAHRTHLECTAWVLHVAGALDSTTVVTGPTVTASGCVLVELHSVADANVLLVRGIAVAIRFLTERGLIEADDDEDDCLPSLDDLEG